MSTGGIFQLITNDGKQDRMLMATALLNKRLLEIQTMRSKNPQIKDPTPTLVDIERTHILFVNAHFKPFCAIGYEYNRTSVQSGSARLASQVQFSIPQFGDFLNDQVLHIVLSSVTATNAAYWTDPVTNVARGAELLAYVNNLGQALIADVNFSVNGNPLDNYDSEVENFHNKFFVTPNKRIGWNRNIGQEVPLQGFEMVDYVSIDGAAINPNLFGRGAGVRQQVQFLDGYQTPKPTQGVVDLWIPLLFWFNKDPRLAIPSVAIPYGQRFINVTLASANAILQQLHAYDPASDNPGANPPPVPDVNTMELYTNNIFVNPEIHDIFIKRIGFSLIRVYRKQVFRTTKSSDSLLMNQLKWPIETIYAGLRPTENIDLQSTKLLTQWDIYSQVLNNTAEVCSLQNGYIWQAGMAALASGAVTATQLDTLFVAFTSAAPNPSFAATFGGLATPSVDQINGVLTTQGWPPLIGTFANRALPSGLEIINATPAVNCMATYQSFLPTIDVLSIVAHGIPLYNAIPSKFFNSYVPYTYGGFHVNTPDDIGALMITFNLYPGSYQPSGHVNVSRAREFYFNYVSSNINTNFAGDLSIVAIAINFLLISDGSAILRYST